MRSSNYGTKSPLPRASPGNADRRLPHRFVVHSCENCKRKVRSPLLYPRAKIIPIQLVRCSIIIIFCIINITATINFIVFVRGFIMRINDIMWDREEWTKKTEDQAIITKNEQHLSQWIYGAPHLRILMESAEPNHQSRDVRFAARKQHVLIDMDKYLSDDTHSSQLWRRAPANCTSAALHLARLSKG